MKPGRAKAGTKEIRETSQRTRPPRMEGVVKEAGMKEIKKKPKKPVGSVHKAQGKGQDSHTRDELKSYHMKSPKPKRTNART